jgi:hypothetical protein
VAVAEDACFDRSQASHAINLCDMHAKYADVIPSADIIRHIMAQPDDLFPNLPAGGPVSAGPDLRLVTKAYPS